MRPLVQPASRTAPILFNSYSGSIDPGGIFAFPSSDLGPRTLVPYYIDSIRMAVFAPDGTLANPGVDYDWRGFPKWKFTLGRYAITDGFIPMWNLCQVRQTVTEQAGYFHWVLPRPLLVTSTQRLQAELQISTNAPVALAAYLSYAGRKLDCDHPVPDEIDLPYVSCWDTSNPNQLSNFESPNTALFNATRKNLQIQRIIGRVQSVDALASNALSDGDDTSLIQIFHHTAVEITNGPTAIRELFPAQTRQLPFSGILPPNQSLHVRLQDLPSLGYQPMFSIVGVRKEEVL